MGRNPKGVGGPEPPILEKSRIDLSFFGKGSKYLIHI